MKQFYSCVLLTMVGISSASAQPILSNGFGFMAAVNGATYMKTGDVGTGSNYSNVSASGDGQYFFAGHNTKVYYIEVTTNAFKDSLTLPSNGSEFSSSNTSGYLFSGANAALYRINIQTKSLDSINVGNTPFRLEERPNSTEIWIGADSLIQIVNYSGTMSSAGNIQTSNSKFDNGDVRFTVGGSLAYKASATRKKIYQINAATKAIIDSINTSPLTHQFAQVSTDSSKLYATSGGKTIYIYSVASKALVDSIVSDRLSMNIYRHPQRAEIWAIDHFADSVVVFKESDNSKLAGIPIGPDPFFIAFSTGTTGIQSLAEFNNNLIVYPNPATDVLKLKLPGKEDRTVRLFNMMGICVSMQTIPAHNPELNIAHLANGLYDLIVYRNNTAEMRGRFIKE